MIINFTLDKIYIEKTKEPKGNIEAKNSIKFLDIIELPTPPEFDQQALLKFQFIYKIEYSQNVAKTEIKGNIHYMTNKEEMAKIMKEWDKESRIDPQLSSRLVNYIFSKCGIKALSLSNQLGLPPHIPIPKVGLRKKESSKQEVPKAS